MKYLPHLVLAAAALAIGSPASATGKMKCNAGPQSGWKTQKVLQDTEKARESRTQELFDEKP